MNTSNEEYQGLCPLCYKPVKNKDDSRILENGDRTEIYHAHCVHDFVTLNTPNDADSPSPALTILEKYKQLIIGHNESDRKQWIAENREDWEREGGRLKYKREICEIKLKDVAEALNISVSRLKRFENGDPVRDAKLLSSGYVSLLYIYELERRQSVLIKYIDTSKLPVPDYLNMEVS